MKFQPKSAKNEWLFSQNMEIVSLFVSWNLDRVLQSVLRR
jgi:hypothetical protein